MTSATTVLSSSALGANDSLYINQTNSTLTGDHQQQQQQQNNNNNSGQQVDSAGMHAVAQTSNAILARLKEVELSNANMSAVMDKLKMESQSKDDKIKELSADKRKDMEQMIDTAVEKWLNSLTDVPDEVRQQFKKGICKIAEQADMKNAAWEIVCNASLAHESNVKKIDELLRTCTEQGETIKTLMTTSSQSDPSFASEASRMIGGNQHKRARLDTESSVSVPAVQLGGGDGNNNNNVDAWQDFEKMMRTEMTSKYF